MFAYLRLNNSNKTYAQLNLRDFVVRIFIVAPNIREMAGIFGTFRQLLLRRYQACITIGYRNLCKHSCK